MRIFRKWGQIGQTLLLPTNRMSIKAILLAYLHVKLSYSKDQGQGHTHFNYEFIANGG